MSHEHKLTCIQMPTWSVLFIVYIYFSYINDTILKKKYVQFKIKFTSNQHTYKCQFEWVQAICHWLVLTFQSRTLPRNSPHIMSQNHKKTMQYEQRCAICNMQYMHRFMHSCQSQEKVSNVSWESWIWDWSPFLFWKKWVMVNKYK